MIEEVFLKEGKEKIYLSGKITGIEEKSFDIFQRAEEFYVSKGFNVVNPHKIEGKRS
jgi:hypothetical protein